MAGSITVAAAGIGGNITRYTVTWLSDALGAVSGNSFPVEAGHVMQVRQIPDAAATQPSDLYDVTVLDANSFDVLVGGGANISNAGPTYITPALTTGYPIFVEAGNLTPVIAAAGNAKGGQIVFYVSPGDSIALGTATRLAASDATLTTAAAVSGAIVSGNAAKFADTSGSVADSGFVLASASALSLVTAFARHALVAGGAAGDITVSGILTTDTLHAVLRIIGAGAAVTDITDLTSEFTITGSNKINNTGGTASTSDKLLVLWTKRV
ncbi:MAG: hypothetical protein V4491_02545 [Pseudomonadota bacterium]